MLSLIEFGSYKPETNQKNVSPFKMHGYFEGMHISVHLGFKDKQALGIQMPLGQQLGVGWGRSWSPAPSH